MMPISSATRERVAAIDVTLLFYAVLAVRLLMGPAADVGVALAGVVAAAWLRPAWTRPAWAALALALLAVLQLLLPRSGWPHALAPPPWATGLLSADQPRWHLAPWTGMRWVMLFAGLAAWAAVLAGDQWRRRDVMQGLTWLATVVALWVVGARVAGVAFPFPSVNHAGLWFAMAMVEPAARLARGSSSHGLALVLLMGGALAAGAWGPLGLGLAGALWAWQRARGLAGRTRRRTLAALSAVAVALVAADAALALEMGLWTGLTRRVSLWHSLAAAGAAATPWGWGFGAFHWVIPPYVTALPAPALRVLHPESGYLWLWFAGGVPAVVVVPWCLRRAHRCVGVAAAAARTALVLVALHALIDVPWLWSVLLWTLAPLAACGWTWLPPQSTPPQSMPPQRAQA